MMNREKLQDELEALLGSRNVYYDPPESIKLNYPCILYKFENFETTYADGKKYLNKPRYTLTLIDKDPESRFMSDIYDLPLCSLDRIYKSDNLSHYVFTLYY